MRIWLFGLAVAMVGGSAMAAEQQEPATPANPTVATSPADAGGEAQTAKKLTLDRLFSSPNLSGASPRALKLSPDGKLVTVLRNRPDEKDRYDLWAMDTTTGDWRMLVDSKKVGTGAELTEAEKMQRERARITNLKGIVAYDWAPDGKSLLVPLDGDLYLAGIDGSVRRLTNTKTSELNPVISPDGGYVSFVRDQNLFVQPIGGGDARDVTKTGKGTVHWGEAEFVAQEEMDRSTGYWWSPGDKRIAVERFDEAPVGVVTRAAIGADGTKVYNQRYPAAGTPNVAVSLYVMKPDGTGRVKVDLGSDPDIYLARVDWTPDGRTLLVQRENRAQTELDMLAVNPISGASQILFSEKAAEHSWINLSDAYRPLRDGSLIWWSERDGHGHLYRFNAGKWTQLTEGDWDVAGLVGVDQTKGRVYFTANKDDVLERDVYSVDLANPGVVTRLTQAGWWSSAKMDADASRMIVTRSNSDQPEQVYLADADGQRLEWISQNSVEAENHPYHPYLASHRETKFGTITTDDGAVLHWEMITPPLEPGKKYPVWFQHYGGPHVQTVSRAWGGPMRQYIVDKGYIFFQIDNRGSANRGTEFEDAIWHAMGSVEVRDQLAGANYLKSLDFVDPKRIGTYGWSYGGYMTLKMLEANPGVYAAGVSGAPVTKWELYDTHYTERYMGDPNKVPEAYAAADAIADAPKIADPMLLLHGMSDDNVVFENSTLLAAKLQAADVPFEMMFYPGKTHTAGSDIHVWTTIFNFFDRTVKNRK
ncbi:DPP IV N-terminal domain-containing protein [Stakelama marina]|uniref:DPP IV N-terminal domain-containing protein n=1 Tax=Stakelama marina TaxID=2826939 RepID=A0A8T4IBH8_9SPHN|nr:DPP IV N-terminal domain-containing protein [Stakelama marina]MBR0551783.1 DPP IV N-terminal domain-containing protein [Stakelama marina]